jgi:transposase-like protein
VPGLWAAIQRATALNRVQVPTDIVFLVVFWRLRYKLSLRDLAGASANAEGSRCS